MMVLSTVEVKEEFPGFPVATYMDGRYGSITLWQHNFRQQTFKTKKKVQRRFFEKSFKVAYH